MNAPRVPLVDPVWVAWRHVNPQVLFPEVLGRVEAGTNNAGLPGRPKGAPRVMPKGGTLRGKLSKLAQGAER